MPFPENPRVVYEKTPLIEVICQLKYPAILRIGSGDLADFQDKIRQNYPIYDLEEPAFPNVPKEMRMLVEQMLPKPLGPRTHKFSTKDGNRFMSLSPDFLALTEFQYTEWSEFRKQLEVAEKALREVYKPSFYSRVGLRYRDLIKPSELGFKDFKWSDLINQPIIGQLGDPNVQGLIRQTRTQTIFNLDYKVKGGYVTFTHGLFQENEKPVAGYVIDTDFAVTNVEDLDGIFGILDKFNKLAGDLFRSAITESLQKALGTKPR